MRTDIRPRLVVAAACVLTLVIATLGGMVAWRLTHVPSAAAAPVPLDTALDPPAAPQVLVFVSGAVAQPGLYRLAGAAHVADAIAAAGGLTADADLGHLPNMAEIVHDGRQVNVPFARSTTTGGTSTRIPFAQRIDVNVATVDQLRGVPGMPLGLAEAIIDARNTFGPFLSLSQLRTILGLDSSTFTAVRPYLRAGRSIR